MRTIDAGTVGGHCHVRLRDLFVRDDAVLGAAGRGFAYAQVRLAPARLTHCMRWLGAAQRAHDVALRHAAERRCSAPRSGPWAWPSSSSPTTRSSWPRAGRCYGRPPRR